MNPQEQLAFIKEKCIEANGSILDLKFGCEVLLWDMTCTYVGEYKDDMSDAEPKQFFEHFGTLIKGHKELNYEIIGRSITLPDVLLAIEKKYKADQFATIASNGWFHFGRERCFWNLLLPLDGQSEEVWSFLYELLSK